MMLVCTSKDQLETDVQTNEIYCKQPTISNGFRAVQNIDRCIALQASCSVSHTILYSTLIQ